MHAIYIFIQLQESEVLAENATSIVLSFMPGKLGVKQFINGPFYLKCVLKHTLVLVYIGFF